MTQDLQELMKAHRFFTHLKPEYIETIADCVSLKSYKPQEMLGKEGTSSDYFFALLNGRVAIETSHPGIGPVVLQTLHGGEVVGWSWLFPPYEWVFDARALTEVQALAFEGHCLHKKCENDSALGFDLMKRFAQVMTLRLKATRLQLLDMYGNKSSINEEKDNE